MAYTIDKAGSGLQISDASGVTTYFSEPIVDIRPSAMGSATFTGGMIIVKQGNSSFQMALAEISQIGGQATGATATAALAQIVALIPSPASVSASTGLVSVEPVMVGGGHIALTTNATGTTFTAFASQACKQLTIANDTGVNLEVQQGSETVYLPVFANTCYTFFGLTNANQLKVRRVDTSNTTVTVKARWES